MSIGPVQLLVLGFDQPDFQGEIIQELDRLRENETIRVIDALVVHKDADGEVRSLQVSQLSSAERAEFGALVGALVGLGAAGEEGMEVGAVIGAAAAEEEFDDTEPDSDWDVLADIPVDTAAALVLLEHRWAIPLRDAIARAGGYGISDGFVSPLDLVALGMVTAEEAEALASIERGVR
jgi:uncharacterized membrane protein